MSHLPLDTSPPHAFRVAESSLGIETGKNKTKIRNKALTFSHQVHGSGSSLAYLQYRRGTPVNHRGIGTVPSELMILRSSGDRF
ncbi:hypothetical protein CDAR_181301 [Caerostris darwini]|uniref:Uncharacterized protein n=1 Tax=Caerostris darwini TaxID=1538125 RepID=A0AAV4U3Z6_9ARAC|nr:hypothetical protein CDAR_181301 [Caerostris darwini]